MLPTWLETSCPSADIALVIVIPENVTSNDNDLLPIEDERLRIAVSDIQTLLSDVVCPKRMRTL